MSVHKGDMSTSYGTKTKGKNGAWNIDPDTIVDMGKSGQGNRYAGVGADPVPHKAAYKDGYETNYKGLPGYGNNA